MPSSTVALTATPPKVPKPGGTRMRKRTSRIERPPRTATTALGGIGGSHGGAGQRAAPRRRPRRRWSASATREIEFERLPGAAAGAGAAAEGDRPDLTGDFGPVPVEEHADEEQRAPPPPRSLPPVAAARASSAAPPPRRRQRVDQQHRDRHRPDPAGHRRDRAGDLGGGLEVDVADEPVLGRLMPTSITTAPGLTASAPSSRGTPTAATRTSARAQVARQVAGARVADGDRRVRPSAAAARPAPRPASSGRPRPPRRPPARPPRGAAAPSPRPACRGPAPGVPWASRPALSGVRPSTSLPGSIAATTASGSM